jgi:outer membrane lipoprotein SlyB
VVESVREVKQQGEGSGLGAVAGGVLGGVLGHQVGGGTGKKVATVAGALGGAFAGHQVEKSARSATKYEVLVRFEDGGTQVVTQDQAPVWRAGDKVRVANGAIVPR